MAVSTLTDNYDALLSTTARNWRKRLEDQISTSTAYLFFIMKKRKAYRSVSDLGVQAAFPLLYQLGRFQAYTGYDILDTTPMDGITTAFYDWRQSAVPIVISGREKKQNRGETKLIDLLESKFTQAEMGIQEGFSKALLRGNVDNGGAIHEAYVDPVTAATFVDPIPLLVKYDPTTSTTIGNINQSTYTWWRNQKKQSAATTYAGWLKEMRNLYNNCGKGPGGYPDLIVAEQQTAELYEAALAAAHRNPSYDKADIPFDAVAFRGNPLIWDEFVPDVHNGTAAITKGSLYMFNTKFFGIKYDEETNFKPTDMQRPVNQDATVRHILWMGANCTSNRRKQGVMGNIDLTIAA